MNCSMDKYALPPAWAAALLSTQSSSKLGNLRGNRYLPIVLKRGKSAGIVRVTFHVLSKRDNTLCWMPCLGMSWHVLAWCR